jgi:glycosyltransferase involved in cell wall biosynthesis
MKIAIDARWIFPEISGIGNYTRQLLREFSRMDMPHTLLVLFSDPVLMERTLSDPELVSASNLEPRCLPWSVFSPQSQLRLPGFLRKEGVDVFHSPNYMIPLLAFPRSRGGRVKCVTTIHDVIPLVFPDHAPKSRKTRLFPIFRALMTEVGRRSDAIITVSEASRRDILKQLRIASGHADKVYTVYNGASACFSPSPSPSLPEGGNDRPRTLLYVGRADPYKNVDALVRALALVRSSTDMDVRLQIAGAPDPRYPQATELAETLGVSSAVTWTGYLMDDALVNAYRTADLLVHPSRYEGFGLQIVESMACGTPVVCSNGGSLPEVAGDAAIQFDPDDVDALVQAITRVLTQPELAADMRERGFAQSARFRWQAAAHQTLDVYEAVAACGSAQGPKS